MTLQIYDWENPLLALAYHATSAEVLAGTAAAHDRLLLEQAYAHCKALTAHHSRSFYYASVLLPQEKRRAIRAFYAFCRMTDDIVDFPDGDVQARLDEWRQKALSLHPGEEDLVPLAWQDTCSRFQIPRHYADQFIDGVSRDLRQTRYDTFAELAEYCYGVASTVGLISMHVVGFKTTEAIPYAVRLGVALQLTNILRDVAEDWRRDRLYLPQEELAAFGLTTADIDAGRVTEAWRNFMKFQIARTRRLYAEARPGLQMLSRDGRLAIAAAADFYAAILKDIERHDYHVFDRRAFVSGWEKVALLPATFWRTIFSIP